MRESNTHSGSLNETAGRTGAEKVARRESYRPTFAEKLRSFGEGVRLRLSSKKTLIVGPFVGEFGHEIMDFQSYVRWFKHKYQAVHVITFPGREPLYRGCLVHSHHYDLSSAGYLYGRISHSEIRAAAHEFARAHRIANYDLFSTIHLCTRWHRRLLLRQEQEVIAPVRPARPGQRVIFHFRNIQKAGWDQTRNFRPDLAEEVCRLCRLSGLEVACIGHPKYALSPSGSQDCRTDNLEATVAEIAACRLVVGELSGPLHLAAYAGKPIAIWAPGKERIGNAFRRNPFNVKVFVVRDDTTNPSPQEILTAVQTAISAL
jgi:hypothetical protein